MFDLRQFPVEKIKPKKNSYECEKTVLWLLIESEFSVSEVILQNSWKN